MHRLSIVLIVGGLVFLGTQSTRPDTLIACAYVASAQESGEDTDLDEGWVASEAEAEELALEAIPAAEDETVEDITAAEEQISEDVTAAENEIVEDAPMASTVEVALFNLANADRVRYGLAPVDLDPSLIEIARTRAAAQLTLERLSHYDATGQLAFASMLDGTGVGYRLAGENLARWGTSDYSGPDRIQQAWMGSPTHRANILEPAFDRLAVGTATNDSGRVAFAQIFRDAP